MIWPNDISFDAFQKKKDYKNINGIMTLNLDIDDYYYLG